MTRNFFIRRDEILALEKSKLACDLTNGELLKILITRGETQKNPIISSGSEKILKQTNREPIQYSRDNFHNGGPRYYHKTPPYLQIQVCQNNNIEQFVMDNNIVKEAINHHKETLMVHMQELNLSNWLFFRRNYFCGCRLGRSGSR
jgi:hypothetical protein